MGVIYILCETAIYLIGMLQILVFFKFMFKFQQVEIELQIVEKSISSDLVLLMLYKLKMRIYFAFCSLIIAITVFVVSYMICELLELESNGNATEFTLIAKTI